MKVDYLIIGQGLAGSILAYQLLERGQSVIVLDEPKLQHCSLVAAGLCNPITGRHMRRTWKAKLLFDYLHSFYPKMEEKLGSSFFYPTPIYRPFQSLEQQQDWAATAEKETEEVIFNNQKYLKNKVSHPFGGLLIKNGAHLRTDFFLLAMRSFLEEKKAYREKLFEDEKLEVNSEGIKYEEIETKHIIFCRGAADKNNRFFEKLPLSPAKGEILHLDFEKDTDVEDFEKESVILNKGCWIVPFGKYYRVGSTYDHKDLSLSPTTEARKTIEEKLQNVVGFDYKVIQQDVGIRPASRTRKPLLGAHPKHKNIHIFNGFGAKGTSMIPYFSEQFIDYLLTEKPLDKEVNIEKYFD